MSGAKQTDSPAVNTQQAADETQVVQQDEQQQQQQQTGQETDSSTEQQQGAEKPANVFEAAKAALAKDAADKAQQGAESSTAETDDSKGTQESDDNPSDDEGELPSAEEMAQDKNLPHKTRKRIQQLLQERQQLSAPAQNWNQLQNWVESSGLTQDDFTQGLAVMAMCNSNPIKAIEVLRNIADDMEKQIGLTGDLPEDIQRRLDAGLIDDETARELARARATQNFHSQRERESMRRSQLERERLQVEAQANAAGQAVTAWERQWQQTDPDYQKLQPFVEAEIVRLMNVEGIPANADDAVKQAQKALDNVRKNVSGIRPNQQQREIKPPTGGHSPNLTAKPKSSFEAAKMAIARG
jgi:uncharacterized protein (UPF0147 family)